MPTVTLALNGRNYDIACGPGQEDRVRQLGERLRLRLEEMNRQAGGSVQETLLLVMTSLLMSDELEKSEGEAGALRSELDSLRDDSEDRLAEMLEALAQQIDALAARLEAA